MPSLTEYLLKPWKFFGALFDVLSRPPKATITLPGVRPAPPVIQTSPFCRIEEIGGQAQHLCSFAGYEMPAFIFWAALLILSSFLVASILLYRQCHQLTATLNKVIRELESISASQTRIPVLRKVLTQSHVTEHSWHEFEETILSSPDSPEEFYTTQPLESTFSKHAIIEENVSGSFFGTIPGILTGVGLLMTFIAILDGLSHVTVSDNMDVEGIAGLINGLSGKFVSSIVAVFCAVSFVFVERFSYSGPNRAYRRLIRLLSRRFKRRTAEHLLLEIQYQLHHHGKMLRSTLNENGPSLQGKSG